MHPPDLPGDAAVFPEDLQLLAPAAFPARQQAFGQSGSFFGDDLYFLQEDRFVAACAVEASLPGESRLGQGDEVEGQFLQVSGTKRGGQRVDPGLVI